MHNGKDERTYHSPIWSPKMFMIETTRECHDRSRIDTLAGLVLRERGIETLCDLEPLQLQQCHLLALVKLNLTKMHLVSGAFPL